MTKQNKKQGGPHEAALILTLPNHTDYLQRESEGRLAKFI